MKILFFSMTFFTRNYKGGMENYLYNLILHLRERHQIILLVPNRFRLSIKNVKVIYFPEGYLFLPRYLKILTNLLRNERLHVISAFIPTFYAGVLFSYAKLYRIKTILNVRGIEPPSKIQIMGNTLAFLFSKLIVTNAKDLIQKYVSLQKLPYKLHSKGKMGTTSESEYFSLLLTAAANKTC